MCSFPFLPFSRALQSDASLHSLVALAVLPRLPHDPSAPLERCTSSSSSAFFNPIYDSIIQSSDNGDIRA